MLISLSLFSCQSPQIGGTGLEQIHRLDDAANFLMLVSDQQEGLNETCNLTSGMALELMGPLHALIDQETERSKHLITSQHLILCEANCHCGVYSDMAQNKQLKNDLYKKAESFPKKQLLQCAKQTARWFCNDKLLETLKNELKSTSVNGL